MNEEKKEYIKTSINLPRSLYNILLELSYELTKKHGKRISLTSIIINAIKQYISNIKKEGKKNGKRN